MVNANKKKQDEKRSKIRLRKSEKNKKNLEKIRKETYPKRKLDLTVPTSMVETSRLLKENLYRCKTGTTCNNGLEKGVI